MLSETGGDFVLAPDGTPRLTRRGRALRAALAKMNRFPPLDTPKAIRAARADLAVLEMEREAAKIVD